MKILQTSIILIFTLLIIPVFTYFFDIPLGEQEWSALRVLIKICGFSIAYCFLVGQLTNIIVRWTNIGAFSPSSMCG